MKSKSFLGGFGKVNNPKHPEVSVKLTGQNGNVFNLINLVRSSLSSKHVSTSEIEDFTNEVTAAESYDDALQIMMRWVKVS